MTFDVTKTYSRDDFYDFLRNFLPDDFEPIEAEPLYADFHNIEQGFKLGECESLDLTVFEFRTKNNSDARVTLTREVCNLMQKYSYHPNALAAFYNDESKNWRFSLITTDYTIENGKVKTEYSNPRRFSFLLGEGCKRHTPEEMLIAKGQIRERAENGKTLSLFDDLKSRFNIEVVTKEFYNELFAWYEWACSVAKYPVGKGANVSLSAENNEQSLIRLVTRLIFVWFIKQKNLVPEWIFDESKLKNVLSEFDSQSKKSGNYYNAVLQNLFFATLNKKIEERKFTDDNEAFKHYGIKTLYRDDLKKSFFKISHDEVVEKFKSVPFLNGGLFECLDRLEEGEGGKNEQIYADGFSREENRRAFLPNSLFFQKQIPNQVRNDGQVQGDGQEHEGIVHILSRYNFTVEENSPSDVQVALDPELLGKVFENLLGTYNPETSETARKDSGSFYTPREIVSFMVNESLVSYLENACSKDTTSKLRSLLESDGAVAFSEEETKKILKNIDKCKILDPACGSGAFPMGILQKMVDIIRKLDPQNNIWKQLQKQKIDENKNLSAKDKNELLAQIDSVFDENDFDYGRKLYLIENCICGIDIQPIAIQIAKLRFFISLIVDQKIDVSKKNYGIRPLPNLETKFVVADSLIGLKEEEKSVLDLEDENLKKYKTELLEVRKNHFGAKTAEEKKNYRKQDKKLREEIINYLRNNASKINQKRIAELESRKLEFENQIKNLPVVMESLTSVNLFGESDGLSYDKNKDARDKVQSDLNKVNKEIEALKNQKKPASSENFEKLVAWNPYDQNAVSTFFDPEWMFGVSDGFDIVIGNPPYIQLQKNGGELAKKYEGENFKSYAKTGDIYCLFYERGFNLLKNDGHLCFITSNKWMRAGYGEKLREFLSKNTNPLLLIDFAGVKIFESATVDTNILLFSKGANKKATRACVTKNLTEDGLKNLSGFIQQNSSEIAFNTSDSWVVLSPIEQSIKQKIEKAGTPLKDWDIQINYGIKTGYNDAFIITTEKRNEILSNCKTADERKRTEELIRPILRGRDIKRYGYDWAGLWLVNAHNGVKEKNIPRIDIKDYPAIKKHLDEYWDKIKDRSDQGDTPYNLRNCAYLEDFGRPKICWNRIAAVKQFAFVDGGIYIQDSMHFIVGKELNYLCSVLNSKLVQWLLSLIIGEAAGGNAGNAGNVLDLHVPHFDKDERLSDKDVYALYGLNDEEIAFIENQL